VSNFVLLGAPNFVLVELPSAQPPPLEDEPVHLNPVFGEVLEVLGLRVSCCDESERVTLSHQARRILEPVLQRYGFDRRPRTVGELCGLFDYCDRLDALTGIGIFESALLEQSQRLAFDLCAQRSGPPDLTAVELYRRGAIDELRTYHQDQATLTVVGQAYRFVPGR
jgi:hypothetical protein